MGFLRSFLFEVCPFSSGLPETISRRRIAVFLTPERGDYRAPDPGSVLYDPAMKTLPGVSQLLRLPETDSTQTVARFLADQGAADRTLVWADRQTGGRGRLSRKWESKPGGLYATLILRPAFAPSRLAEVSLLAGAAAAEALTGLCGVAAAVKPPNDVYAASARGRAKKVCGILCEAAGGQTRVDWLLVGLGVNVNNPVSLPTAVSLKRLTKKAWDVEDVLRAVLAGFWRRYDAL
jgi:BirA family biotin operon repressor/biotin-[acetyl-CoA-carboxylase] ligase